MSAEKAQQTTSQLLIYQSEDGQTKIEVQLQDETVWLTQAHLAELFQVKPQNITMHLKNIYAEGELAEESTCKEFLQVQTEGGRQVRRTRKLYYLDAIISVGYRVKSHVATRFRQWATRHASAHRARTLWRVFFCPMIGDGDELKTIIENLNETLAA